ncbi:hypothetical protein D915_002307 [Fasciola hepatica]|uniref:EB1 C-terminal domain-containing protein n=1 Tax=Fasciola hepatica TaxID=6192 RepID=A0A4E0S318_FASHE|nr:hypothetical protein D915_002307 [Fasciola hepatica]
MTRVKTGTKFESDAISNYKLLLHAFQAYEVRKDIPINNLVKGRFSDNFRFAQWFKLFYDANRSKLVRQAPEAGDCRFSSRTTDHQYPRRSKSVTGHEVAFSFPESPGLEEHLGRPVSIGSGAADHRHRAATRQDISSWNRSSNNATGKATSEINTTACALKETVKSVEIEEETYVDPSDQSDAEVYEFPSPLKKDPVLAANGAKSLSMVHASNQTRYPEDNVCIKCAEYDYADYINEDQIGNQDHPANSSLPIPSPKRRAGTVRPQRSNAVQLPPPSPSSHGQHSVSTTHRSNRRPATATSWNPKQNYPNFLASGDRPTNQPGLVNEQQTSTTEQRIIPNTNCSDSSAHAAEICPERSRHCRTAMSAVGDERPTKANSYSPITERRVSKSTQSSKSTSPTRPGNSKSSKEFHRSDNSVGPMTDSVLQQELAMLRFETLGQRRSLFYCQKEAQFYFKKLRQIEELCIQLSEMKEKPKDGILEAIFEILYETEVRCLFLFP